MKACIALSAAIVGLSTLGCSADTVEDGSLKEVISGAEELGEPGDTPYGCCKADWGSVSDGTATCNLYGPGVVHTGSAWRSGGTGYYQSGECPNGCDGGFVQQYIRAANWCWQQVWPFWLPEIPTSDWESGDTSVRSIPSCGYGEPFASMCEIQVCAAFISGTEPGCQGAPPPDPPDPPPCIETGNYGCGDDGDCCESTATCADGTCVFIP